MKTKVRVTVRGSFSKLVEEVGEIKTKEGGDQNG